VAAVHLQWGLEVGLMRTVEELVKDIRRLSSQDRLRLIAELEELGRDEDRTTNAVRVAALDVILALAGTAVTDHTDVSSNKYKHLTEIYSDDHEHK
jgi:hypothetical protein